MNCGENGILNDMQHACKCGSVLCQKGKASSCINCMYYESKVKVLASKNDECQREIHRLCQTLSILTKNIADKIYENKTLRDRIASIHYKTLEQNESAVEDTVRDVSSFLETQMKEDLQEYDDVVNGPVDSHSVEDTNATDETEKLWSCMWMVPDGKDMIKCGKEFPTIEILVSHCKTEHRYSLGDVRFLDEYEKGKMLVESQQEVRRLNEKVSLLTRQFAKEIEENNMLLKQLGSLAENDFPETSVVNPKEEPKTSAKNLQRIGYVAEESSQMTADTVQINKEPDDEEEEDDYSQNMDVGSQIPGTRQAPVFDPKLLYTCLWMTPNDTKSPMRCEKAFPSPEGLQSHFTSEHLPVAKHDGHVCLWEGCVRDKVPCPDSWHLQSHFRNHSGKKPYPCPHRSCGKTFADRGRVRKHTLARSYSHVPTRDVAKRLPTAQR